MAKKLLAMLLALAMLFSLAACGEGNVDDTKSNDTQGATDGSSTEQSEAPTLADPSTVEFSVMLEASIEDASQMPIMKVLEEATGYAPEYIEVSPAAAEDQFELLWLEEDLPNVVMFKWTRAKLDSKFREELIVDLAPYMTEELMPNMHKYLQEHEWEEMKDSEGHIYFFPFIEDSYLEKGLAINQEWLKAVNMDMPETPDELLEVWRAFKTQDPNGNGKPDEIPFSTELIWSNAILTLDPMFGMFGNVGNWQVDENGKVFFGNATDAYKEGVKWFQQAYKEGLIDSEIFTQDGASFAAKAASDPKIYGSVMSFSYTSTRCFGTEIGDEYTWMLPMKASDGNRYWLSPSNTTSNVTPKMAVTADTDPETIKHICRWVDAMIDPHIGAQIDMAPEGIGLVDQGDGTYNAGSGVCPDADLGSYATYDEWRAAMHTNEFPRVLTNYAEAAADFTVDLSKNLVDACYWEREPVYRENCIMQNFLVQDGATEEEAEIEATYKTELNKYWRATVASWISGNGDIDAEWDEYLETLDAMGLQELAKVYQARYDRAVG